MVIAGKKSYYQEKRYWNCKTI